MLIRPLWQGLGYEGQEQPLQQLDQGTEKGDGPVGQTLVRFLAGLQKRDDVGQLPNRRDIGFCYRDTGCFTSTDI